MNMIVIDFFWIGSKVTPVEVLTFQSCISNNMQPVLWSYEKVENVPDFVIVKDAKLIFKEELIYYYLNELKIPIPSISDIFRYELLYQKGGIYSDTDIVFINNLNSILEGEYFCSTYEYVHGECASNCFMKIEKESEVAKYLVLESNRVLNDYIKDTTKVFNYCDLGPFIVQRCAAKLSVKVLPFDIINPISWRFTDKVIAYEKPDYKFKLKNLIRRYLPGNEKRGYWVTKNTLAVHLCHEMWKQKGIDKYKPLHPSCLYEQLRKRYKISFRN